jgi:hypothetical protein
MNYILNGDICFGRALSETEQKTAMACLRGYPDELSFEENDVLSLNNMCRGLAFMDHLEALADWAKKADIKILAPSDIHYSGDDYGIYIWDEEKEEWNDFDTEDAVLILASDTELMAAYRYHHPEYPMIEPVRLLQILKDYVMNDAEAASDDTYVATVLTDICGMTREEVKEIGLGYLLTTE